VVHVPSHGENAGPELLRIENAGNSDLPIGATLSLKLVNMPYADWHFPSLALSQLAALTGRELAGRVDVQVCYVNQDFAARFDARLYEEIVNGSVHTVTGIGDWVFRHIAYPELRDNSDEYFSRYYVGSPWTEFRAGILGLRPNLERFCLDMIDRYELASADIVGFTSMFAQNGSSLALARLIKQLNPRVTIVMGGANCETPMGAVLVENFPAIDFVFSGPSLDSFMDFLRCKLRGDESRLHAIRGIISKENCGDARFRGSVGHEHDINDFFEPDYRSFVAAFQAKAAPMGDTGAGTGDVIAGIGSPTLFFETSRGCWWGARSHCTFCGLNGETLNFRAMAPDIALRQFQSIFRFAPWCLEYECTDNIMPKNYLKEVFPFLDPPAGSSMFYEVKVPISEKDMQVLADANVTKVQPGIEALSTATLKLMGKGTSAFQNVQFLKNCVRFGIEPDWNLLMGFPGEEEDTFRKYIEDIPLLRHLPPPRGVGLVRFDRYSPYYNRSSEYGLDLRPMDFYSLVYPFGEDDLGDLAYFFHDHQMSSYQVNSATWYRQLSECVDQWKEEWDDAGRRSRLVLRREADGNHAIYDSRGETNEAYGVHEETAAMLERLSSPIRCDRVASECGLPPEAASDRLSFLRAHDLLFEEDGRVMSLVITEPR
jgi:ribosomal peptide maturation radical SAM protein 1